MKVLPDRVMTLSKKVSSTLSNRVPLNRISEHLGALSIISKMLYAAFFSCAALYVLFQKKLLPRNLSLMVSKVAFFPTMPMTAWKARGNYMTEIDDTLILGCAPFSAMGHPQHLSDMGVKGVINMCLEYRGPERSYEKLGITQLRLPTVDHFESSPEQLEEAIRFIESHQKRGERVYVHCKAGHGRAAAVALCWMAHEHPEIPPSTLNAALFGKRRVRKKLFRQKNVVAVLAALEGKGRSNK